MEGAEWISSGTRPRQPETRGSTGCPFPLPRACFLDVDRLEWADTRRHYAEPRWVTVGLVEGFEIVVVYTVRGQSIRIISAGKAVQYEREDYWNR